MCAVLASHLVRDDDDLEITFDLLNERSEVWRGTDSSQLGLGRDSHVGLEGYVILI